MPDLVRLYIRNVIVGFVLAGVFTALLIGLNVGNLRHLVASVSGGVIAVILLVVFNGIVFAGVQFAFAVMAMAGGEDASGGGTPAPRSGARLVAATVPVPRP